MPDFSAYARMLRWLEEHNHWDNHPDYPVEDWKYEVANADTRQGYADWLLSMAEAEDFEAAESGEEQTT